jgi:hypothetical protein
MLKIIAFLFRIYNYPFFMVIMTSDYILNTNLTKKVFNKKFILNVPLISTLIYFLVYMYFLI